MSETRPSHFIFDRFCFYVVIDEVVAEMSCWNKVFSISSYLDDVRSDADKGLSEFVSPDLLVPSDLGS